MSVSRSLTSHQVENTDTGQSVTTINYGRVGLFKLEELSQTVKELWHILDVQD